jgi:hypothetical protein
VRQEVSDGGHAEGLQSIEGGGARAERWRAGEEGRLVGLFGVVEQGQQKPGPFAEVPEDGALAHRRGTRDGVHGDVLDTVLCHQPRRRLQEACAVAYGVGAHRPDGSCRLSGRQRPVRRRDLGRRGRVVMERRGRRHGPSSA